jgi:hypothetical protein
VTERRLGRLRGWCAARPARTAAIFYLLLALVFVGQGLLPGRTLSGSDMLWSSAPWTDSPPDDVRWGGANFELNDGVTQFEPFLRHTRASFPEAPLWNPYIMAGRPFLANAQSAVFSPFSLPAYVLPFWKALAVVALLKLWAAAFGTYLLGRALGMRFGGALLAGVVFAFGTFFVVWLAWPLANVFALLPWLLLLTELLIRRPEPLVAAGLAAVVALAFLGGHPETTFHVVVAAIVYFAFRLLVIRQGRGLDRRSLLRPTLHFAVALGAGAAMAAVMLLPLLELFVESGDVDRRLGFEPGHAESRFLATFFLFDYWGRPTQTPLLGIVSNRGYYAGGITLMLAAVGLILRPAALRLFFLGAGILALFVVLGVDPVFSAVTSLPGFRTAHNGRMVIFVLLALALLAGWGLDELTRVDRERPRRRLAIAAAVLIFLAPIVGMTAGGSIAPSRLGDGLEVAFGMADPPPPVIGAARDVDVLRAVGDPVPPDTIDTIRLSALLQWMVFAGGGLALVVAALASPGGRARRLLPVGAIAVLAVAVLTLDLFRADMGFNTAIPIDHAEQPRTGAIDYLESRRPNRFAGFARPGVGQPLPPNLAIPYGLYDVRGYDYPVVRRFDDFWRATAAPPGEFVPPTSRAEPNAKAVRGMSLLSVSDIVQDPADPPVALPGLWVAYDGPDARIYRNANALPRVFLVGGQRVVPGADAALLTTIAPGFDARGVAVTEERVDGLPVGPAGRAGTARLVAYEDERVVADATAARPSLLVLTDVYFPGWKAEVDGREVPIERVNYLMRGVVVPPGEHRVELRYEPLSWRLGWIVSLLATLAVAAVAAVDWRRRRARSRTAAG